MRKYVLVGLLTAVLVVGAFASFVVLGYPDVRSQTPPLNQDEAALLALINDYRLQHGLSALKISPTLSAAARWMSEDMAEHDYLGHTDSLGREMVQRMADFGYPPADRWGHVSDQPFGELMQAGSETPEGALEAWRNSPGHNAVMLTDDFVVAGVGKAQNLQSTYGWYWTVDFGGYDDPQATSLTPLPTGIPSSRLLTPTVIPSPTPTATPTGTAAPSPWPVVPATPTGRAAAAPDIGYLNNGDIWLAAADGSGRRNLTQGGCASLTYLSWFWSPGGDRIACMGDLTGFGGQKKQIVVVILDLEGRVLLRLERAGDFGLWAGDFGHWAPWSPSGRRVAYVVGEWHQPAEALRASTLIVADATGGVLESIPGGDRPSWSSQGDRLAYYQALDDALVVYEPDVGEHKVLAHGLRPLAWVLGDKALLVGAKWDGGSMFWSYEANLFDPASGQTRRIPELDGGRQFWLSPDGGTAATTAPGTSGASLGILNLSSLQFTAIAGSFISFGGEAFPEGWIAFSPDGSQVYWATQVYGDQQAPPGDQAVTAVFRANIDGTGLTKVDVPGSGWFVAFSPDVTRILYSASGDLWEVNVDGSDARLLAEQFSGVDAAWRPSPNP